MWSTRTSSNAVAWPVRPNSRAMYRFGGPVLGAVVLVLLQEAITRRTLYSDLVLGLVLLAIVLLAPGGLTEIGARVAGRLRRPRASRPEPDTTALKIGAPS